MVKSKEKVARTRPVLSYISKICSALGGIVGIGTKSEARIYNKNPYDTQTLFGNLKKIIFKSIKCCDVR